MTTAAEPQHQPLYGGYLSNHLPMARHAMAALGAPAAAQDAFAQRYAQQLVPLTPADKAAIAAAGSQPLASVDWHAMLGVRSAWPTLVGHCRATLAAAGAPGLLDTTLPTLLPALAVDAFHPLLRTGHALAAGGDPELAMAVAYWISAWQPLAAGNTPCEPLAAMAKQHHQGAPDLPGGSFNQRLVHLAASGAWPDGHAPLPALAHAALAIHRSTRGFFALHMVTASQAARVVAEAWGKLGHAERALGSSLLACHLLVGAPDPAAPPQPLHLDQFADDEEHLWKLAWAVRELAAVSPEPAWQAELANLQHLDHPVGGQLRGA